MEDPNPEAFPLNLPSWGIGEQRGMKLRDYFAAIVLAIELEHVRNSGWISAERKRDIAIFAYQMADAMLEARLPGRGTP